MHPHPPQTCCFCSLSKGVDLSNSVALVLVEELMTLYGKVEKVNGGFRIVSSYDGSVAEFSDKDATVSSDGLEIVEGASVTVVVPAQDHMMVSGTEKFGTTAREKVEGGSYSCLCFTVDDCPNGCILVDCSTGKSLGPCGCTGPFPCG